MPEQSLNHIEEKIITDCGRFYSQGKAFSGYPKPLLRKTEEKIEKHSEVFAP